jgi:hypothetical protein
MPDAHIDNIFAGSLGFHGPAGDLVAKQKPDQAVEQCARQNEYQGLRDINHFEIPPPQPFLAGC